MDWQTWIDPCAEVLRGNQISSGGYRYTRPAPHVYEHQWLWDSCFHAITYRWLDPDMAAAELLSMAAGQVEDGPDAGMIPHMIYWRGGGAPLWGRDDRSIITQPPLLAMAALLIHQQQPNRALLEALYPRLCAYQAWFDRRRDPDGDDLVTIIHPWESGWDASPRWDGPMGLHQPTDDESKAARHALVQTLIAHDCDAERLEAAGSFAVEPVDYNAIRAADLEALAVIAAELGADPAPWRDRACAVQRATARFLHDGDFWDLSSPDKTPVKVRSAAPFVLLFGGCVDAATAAELVHQLTGPTFWTPYPVPTTPADDSAFDPDHYWRGNVWASVNWLIYRGLKRYGYAAEASHMAARFAALIAAHGFHEYFNPLTGAGHGPDQQSWATVVLDMLATEGKK